MKSVGPCYTCKCEMWIPDALYESANHAKGRISFYCAYGHSQVFCVGDNEETKLRRERDLLKQRLSEKDDTIKYWRESKEQTEKRLSATKGVVTRIMALMSLILLGRVCHRGSS